MSNETVNTAYTHIRNKILSGHFAPGHRLRAELLAKEIGISRTPIQDALRLLEVDGLVVIRPQQGATVRYMSYNEFRNLSSVREALECHAAGLAAVNRTEDEVKDLGRILDALKKLTAVFEVRNIRDEYVNDMGKMDVEFHMCIVGMAKNPLLQSEILRFQVIHRVMIGIAPIYTRSLSDSAAWQEEIQATLKEHVDIFNAIHAKDEARAKSAMEIHIRRNSSPIIDRMKAKETMRINADLGYLKS